jgi:hypothetical protein
MKYLVDANVLSEPTRPAPDARVIDWLSSHESDLVWTRSSSASCASGFRGGLRVLKPHVSPMGPRFALALAVGVVVRMMIRMTLKHGVSLFALALLAPGPVHSLDLSARASLAELRVIGGIVVTMSAGSKRDEDALRQVIEKRLEGAGIGIDSAERRQLVANVDIARDTSTTGQKHFSYLIALSFQEPVRTERTPRTTFRGKTWSGTASVTRFGVEVQLQSILDALENKMSDFLTTVAKDTAAAKEAAGR